MSDVQDNSRPAPKRGQCRAVLIDRLQRLGVFWLRFRRLGTEIRELASWFESRARSSGLGGEDDCVRVAIGPDGEATAKGWPARELADLAQWPRVWAMLAAMGVRRVRWDVRLESNQIRDVLGLLYTHRRGLASASAPGGTAGALRSDFGVQYACTRTRLVGETLEIDYSYCTTRFSRLVSWFERRRGDFRDHRALYRAAPRYSVLVGLVALGPFVLYLLEVNWWVLLAATIVGTAALLALTYTFFMAVGGVEYDNEEKAYRLERTYEQLKRHSDRIQEDLSRARLVQQKLLPDLDRAPLRDRLHFAASFVPETDVGGDYFDVDRLAENTLAVMFADVSGHGMSAALVTVIIKTTFHSWIEQGQPMAEFIADLNLRLCRLTPDDSFAALAVATCDVRSGRLQYSNCGHNPPPRLVRGNSEGVVELNGARGMILGAIEEAEPMLAEVVLRPGDKLVFATDGITEAVDEGNRMYGVERLDAFLANHRQADAKELVAHLVADVARYTGSASQKDDQTILALQVR